MRVCALQHQDDAPAALWEDWALAREHDFSVLRPPELTRWPDPRSYDAICSLGSDCSVAESDNDWIASEISFLRSAHEANVPLLGICFGAQALAQALGGEVRRGSLPAVSWRNLPTARPDLVGPGPWFRWHEDVFSSPPGAQEISKVGDASLAFVLRASVGLQFHPEVDLELVERWVSSGRDSLVLHGVDVRALGVQAAGCGVGARERAYELFDRLAEHWARLAMTFGRGVHEGPVR